MPVRSARSLSRNVAGAGLIVLTIGAGSCTSTGAQQRQIETVSDALGCARGALGGPKALSAISSLAVTFEEIPDPSVRNGQRTTSEITLGFPAKFKATSRLRLPGREDFVLVRGFAGDRQFVGPAGDNQAQIEKPDQGSFRVLRSEFARWALMLLLRETPVVPLKWSPALTPDGAAHVRIAATGPDSFNIALLLDNATCQPLGVMWDRAPNYDDAMSGRTSPSGRHVERRDLLDYRTFDGIRLPARIRTAVDGVPRGELKLITARVNPALPDELAQSRALTVGRSNAPR